MKPYLGILLALSLTPLSLFAQTPEQRGLEIAVEADKRDSGWQDYRAAMRMILRNRQGDTSEREIRVRALEVQGDGDKSLTIFDHPADVAGTAFQQQVWAALREIRAGETTTYGCICRP